MQRIVVLTAVLVLISLSTGFAADRFYVALHGSLVGLLDVDHNNTAAGESLTSDYFPGFGVGAALGTIIQQRFRLEAEIAYRHHTFGEFTRAGVEVGGSGGVDALAFMANGFFDLHTGTRWTPYVGAGVGFALVTNDIDAFGAFFSDPPFVDDTDGVLAYQAMVGITYQVTQMISIGLGYRFFATWDPEFTDVTGRRFDAEYMTHNFELGLRLRF